MEKRRRYAQDIHIVKFYAWSFTTIQYCQRQRKGHDNARALMQKTRDKERSIRRFGLPPAQLLPEIDYAVPSAYGSTNNQMIQNSHLLVTFNFALVSKFFLSANTFSEVTGRFLILTPTASCMALAIAGATVMMGVSPMLMLLYGPRPTDVSTTILRNRGTSRAVGIL